MKRTASFVENYEESARSFVSTSLATRELLPVKTVKGKWKPLSATVEVPVREKKLPKPNIPSESISIDESYIAQLCLKITQDPTEHISLISKLRSIVLSSDCSFELRSLAALSLLSLFKDVLPSYSIRELTEVEKKAKVSQEVQKQRSFESNLVSQFQQYVKSLQSVFLSEDEKLSSVSLQCLCDLLSSCRDFNFHSEILSFFVRKIVLSGCHSKKSIATISKTLAVLFKADSDGKDSLFVVQNFSDYLQSHSYTDAIHPTILHSLSCLQIRQGSIGRDLSSADLPSNVSQIVPGAKYISKNERKKLKEQLASMHESHGKFAVTESKHRIKRYRDLVKHLFRIYFGILKWHNENGNSFSALLDVCMEGLGKFTHLIGVEFFGDLMASLRSLSSIKRIADTNVGLRILNAAFRILDLRIESSFFDLKTFYVYLFELLQAENKSNSAAHSKKCDKSNRNLVSAKESSTCNRKSQTEINCSLLKDVFGLMFFKKQSASLPHQRILSFAEVLGQLAIAKGDAWTELLAKMMQKYPKLKIDFFDEEDCYRNISLKDPSDPDCPRINKCDREAIKRILS